MLNCLLIVLPFNKLKAKQKWTQKNYIKLCLRFDTLHQISANEYRKVNSLPIKKIGARNCDKHFQIWEGTTPCSVNDLFCHFRTGTTQSYNGILKDDLGKPVRGSKISQRFISLLAPFIWKKVDSNFKK